MLAVSTNPSQLSAVQTSTATTYTLGFMYGTTYYWQVTAKDGFGGTAVSGLQTFFPAFRNSPPTVPLNLSKSGTIPYHGRTPALSFFWQESSDPEGDPFTYSIYFGTDSARLRLLSGAALGYALSSVALDTAYYYRIVATDIYGAASSSSLNWVYFQFTNSAPGAFDPVGPSGPVVTRDANQTLSWTSSQDPDADPVAYRVTLGTSSSSLNHLLDTTQTTALLTGLSFGTSYYWRVEAFDGLGGTTTVNGGTQSFAPAFRNSSPSVPAYLSTAAVYGLHTLTPRVALSWTASQDADNDPVTQMLEVRTATGAWLPIGLGASTSFALDPLFDTTYYWRVSAADPFGGVSAGAWSSFIVRFVNRPPESFAPLTGTGTLATRATTQVLSWEPSVDPDGDPVLYGLRLSTEPGYPPLIRVSTAADFTLSFQNGATYYWTVEAYDGLGGTRTVMGDLLTFHPTFLNEPPSPLSLRTPFTASPVVNTMDKTVSISWEQVTTPQDDPVTYTVYLGDSPDALEVLARIGREPAAGARLSVLSVEAKPQSYVEQDGRTIRLRLTGLTYYRSYYLRIVASNPYGASSVTPLETFSLSPQGGFPKAYNYPNPFSPGRGGTRIVFNAPPSGYARAVVSVYSELQDLLFRREYTNIPPGVSEVPFDGRDKYGRSFFNGSYICRVHFEGPDDKETFYLLVVK